MQSALGRQRLIAVFALGMVMLNDPVLELIAAWDAGRGYLLQGYLLVSWGVILGLTGWLLEARAPRN